MFEAVILFILTKYDATIYKVRRIIDEDFFGFLKSSTGTISPAFKRLENIGCVTCLQKMSDGGMLSKTFSITKEGENYLKNYLLNFRCENPYHILNEAKVAIWCSEVLKPNEYEEFKKNMLNNLELYKIKLIKGLENEYIKMNDTQRKTVEITLDNVNKVIELL